MKKILLCIAIFVLLCAASITFISAADNDSGGIKFNKTDYYQTTDNLPSVPLTFETWIKLSEDMPDTSKGPIVGNYDAGTGPHDVINFEIAELGVPKIYIRVYDKDAGKYADAIQIYFPGTYNNETKTFDDRVDLRTGQLTYLAVTLDPSSNKAYCYINGELASTFSGEYYYYSSGDYLKSWKTYNISSISSMTNVGNVAIGRDHRTGTVSYLDGTYSEVLSVAMYSEKLTADKISAHNQATDYSEASLIGAYDFTKSGIERLADHSDLQNHLYYTNVNDSSLNEFYKGTGFKPERTDYYQTTEYVTNFPYTFESWVNISTEMPDTAEGPLAGNYDASNGDAVNFIVSKLGVPRVYLKPYNEQTATYGSGIDVFFPEVDLRTGKPTHIAITFEPSANKAYCYINGELKSTFSGQKYYYNASNNAYGQYSSKLNINVISDMNDLEGFAFGRDHRSGSYLFPLDGDYAEIYSVAMFSEAKDATTIKNNLIKVDNTDATLLCNYNFTRNGNNALKDYSSNGNHLMYSNTASTGLTRWYETIDEGYSFLIDNIYKTEDIPTDISYTIEASVYFPAIGKINFAGGVILSTRGVDKGGLSLEIGTGGTVIFTSIDQNGVSTTFAFNDVCVYNKEITHIAVTIDKANSSVNCYIDGILAQSLPLGDILYKSYHIAYSVGGDYQTNNKYSFSGKLISCAAYSDVRSADEIASDVDSLDKSSLMFAYDYRIAAENGYSSEILKDFSDNGNDASVPVYLIGDKLDSDFESAYSFAIIGDTQSLNYYYPDKLSSIYDWVVNNIDDKNIKFVMGLGDITETNSKNEWDTAKEQILKLHGKVPYSLAVGNHDTSAMLNSTFFGTGYGDQVSGNYNGGLENTYTKIEVGSVKYLIFSLDCGASDEVLSWAGEIISSNSDYNVIITTHAYLFRDGTTLDSSDRGNVTEWGYSNNGDDIWNKLASKYDNVTMVISGHINSDEIVMSKQIGDNGNIVTELLINPQDVDAKLFPAGLVAMLHFSEDGKDVRVEYYSTVQSQYFMSDNQFETTVDTVESESPASKFVPKYSLTLDSDFILNIYVPAIEGLLGFTVDGKKYSNFDKLQVKEIDGKSFYQIKIPLPSSEAARSIELVASINSEDTVINGTFTFSIVKYAKKILNDGSETEKTLIMDMLSYIKAAYEYFGSASVADIDTLLGSYERELLIEGSASVPESTYLSAATLDLNAEPCMLFYMKDGYTSKDFVFTQGGKVLDTTEGEDKNGRYIKIKLYAYGMCESVSFTVNGDTDSYHIHSYYAYAKTTNDSELISLVEAFWKYCQSARDYRNEILREGK